jgi:beta-glucuronidase
VKGFKWAFAFEQARRRTTVYLNGHRIGISIDPYTPFQVPAKYLVPGKKNVLDVTVDNRKDPRLPEGWWNWGGITRPVRLIPIGAASLTNLGLMSDVKCKGPARSCKAKVLLNAVLDKLPKGPKDRQPTLNLWIRSPTGKVTSKSFKLKGLRSARRKVDLAMTVPAPKLWSPDKPQLYDSRVTVTYNGARTEVDVQKIGLRSVTVKGGLLNLNNRPINLRGASIHEDMPGHGAAITPGDMDTIVRELKELGANVVRAHYTLSQGLLRRLDAAGIMVWNETPVWQRDVGGKNALLRIPIERARAYAQVERTVLAGRSHPSVITHATANELALAPDRLPSDRTYLRISAEKARMLDPTLPISIDIKTRPSLEEQFSYQDYDMIGINQYFGWYPWVADFNLLGPFLQQMRDNYPDKALVMTEFGAEARPEWANAPADMMGSYAFQAMHVGRTMDLVDNTPFLSGAIHWTLREFEIYPNWFGGAPPSAGRNTRHYKGVLTYEGQKKPAWQVLHDHFARTPLYR